MSSESEEENDFVNQDQIIEELDRGKHSIPFTKACQFISMFDPFYFPPFPW